MTGAARTLEKVLVANRGEIARRVVGTLRKMGIASVVVYSDADAAAPHVREADEAVRVGPAPAAESYLVMDRLVDAARAIGADAVHPGYGFLAENAEFAERCRAAGLVFVGPPTEAIRRMGSKTLAKTLMEQAGVPVVPGFAVDELAEAEVARCVAGLGYPVLVKAAAGGGGKGMRVVREEGELAEALAAARREASAAFGDPSLLVERYLETARHVEIQIFGDAHGRVVHLFERDCSVQRRHQKVIEEAPAPGVDDALRARLGAAAVAAGKALGYEGAGTVEFLLAPDGAFHFLEVNTRLQVEHPVTEAVTGLDLVRLQLEVAGGLPLALPAEGASLSGHAIEARLYAEDAARGFLPATGRVALWDVPELPGLRVDAGVEAGSEVGSHYDPLLAKVIAHGATREDARRRLVRGLRELAVGGLVTNRDFLVAVLEHAAFREGALDTRFLARHEVAAAPPDAAVLRLHAAAAALFAHAERRATGGPLPPSLPSGWRNNRWRPQDQGFRRGDARIEVLYTAEPGGRFALEVDATPLAARGVAADLGSGHVAFEADGVRRSFRVARAGARLCVHGAGAGSDLEELPRFPPVRRAELAGGCVAPMTGVVRRVCATVGAAVAEGELLLVLEAMKMEHRIVAHAAGVVREVRVREGDTVEPDDVLVVVEAEDTPA